MAFFGRGCSRMWVWIWILIFSRGRRGGRRSRGRRGCRGCGRRRRRRRRRRGRRGIGGGVGVGIGWCRRGRGVGVGITWGWSWMARVLHRCSSVLGILWIRRTTKVVFVICPATDVLALSHLPALSPRMTEVAVTLVLVHARCGIGFCNRASSTRQMESLMRSVALTLRICPMSFIPSTRGAPSPVQRRVADSASAELGSPHLKS